MLKNLAIPKRGNNSIIKNKNKTQLIDFKILTIKISYDFQKQKRRSKNHDINHTGGFSPAF